MLLYYLRGILALWGVHAVLSSCPSWRVTGACLHLLPTVLACLHSSLHRLQHAPQQNAAQRDSLQLPCTQAGVAQFPSLLHVAVRLCARPVRQEWAARTQLVRPSLSGCV